MCEIYAYITYIRPSLEFSTPVWSPSLKKDIDLIENVQRSFTRRIPGLKHLPYHERLAVIGLETLEIRRLKFDLMMYYKIFHGIVSLDISGFFNVSPNNHGTRDHDYKIIKAPYINSVFDNLFSTRCVDCWNDLPSEFVNIDSVCSF